MFRRLITLVVTAVLAAVLVPSALAVQAKIRVEGKTTTIFGAVQPSLEAGTNALMALDAASLAGEFYYHVTVTGFGPFVDQIGRYPGEGFSGWSYKINGVSPPVGADQATIKTGDTVLWYWSTFTPQGGSPTLLLKRRAARNCYSVLSQNDLGQTSRPRERGCSSMDAASPSAPDEVVSASTAASYAPLPRMRSARTLSGEAWPPRRLCARPARRLRARAHRLRDRLALDHPRPRRDGAPRPDGAGGADRDAGARQEGGHLDALRRPLCPVDRGVEGALQAP